MLLILLTAILILSVSYLVHNYLYAKTDMRCYQRSFSVPNKRGAMGNLFSNCFRPSARPTFRPQSSLPNYESKRLDGSPISKSPPIYEGKRLSGSPIFKSSTRVESLVDDVSNLQLDHGTSPPGFSSQFPVIPSCANEICENAWADEEDPTEVFAKAFDIEITRRDLQTLDFGRWLNDEVINFYLSLIVQRSKQYPGLPKVYAFNTFFLKSLKAGGYSRVRRWTKNVDIFSYEILLVPVHLGNHWCLAVIDLIGKEMNYYDSLGGTNDECLNALKRYIQEEHMDKKKAAIDLSGWKFRCPRNIPKQMNGSDCGVFACCFAEHLSMQKELKFDQRVMSYYRQRMVYEIVNMDLL